MAHTRKLRSGAKGGRRRKNKGKASRRMRAGKTMKRGGNIDLVMAQLATPAVLFAANQMYGKRVSNRGGSQMSRSRRSQRRR